jgi:hypothetical protein
MAPQTILGPLRTLLLLIALGALVAGALPAHAAPWAGNRQQFAAPGFAQLWAKADRAVAQRRTARSWTWGPHPWFDYQEVYKQSPNGRRLVQYFDKARMEITDPAQTSSPLGGVTNGLLVVEMVAGRLKLGDGIGPDQNQTVLPADRIPVAGDLPTLSDTYLTTTSYASFRNVATIDNGYRDQEKLGQRVGTTFGPGGTTAFDQALADLPGTQLVRYEALTGHNIPRVFDDFLRASPIPALVAFGYPITDPYWITARLAGQERQILVQLFERRTLTYTPRNPPAFLVEMGNVGQHYFMWRYGTGQPWAMGDPQLPITFASKRDGGDFTAYEMDANGANQVSLGGSASALLPSSVVGWWFPELPQHYRVIYGDTTAFSGKRQLARLLPQAPPSDRFLSSDANDYEPAISPDFTQLAFVSDRDGNPELYLLVFSLYRDPAGEPALQLTDTRDCAVGHPSWLPDGSGLVYESNCQDGAWAIYRAELSYTLDDSARIAVAQLISPRPEEAERLTRSGADDRWPRVAPDGSQIAFVSSRDGNAEIYTMALDGGNHMRLTASPSHDEAPIWSMDSQQIVFTSDRDGDLEIWKINRDGGGLVQLTNNESDDAYAVWGP